MSENTNINGLIAHLKNNLPAIYEGWLQTHITQVSNKNNAAAADFKDIVVDTLPYTFILSVSDGYKKAKVATFVVTDLIQSDTGSI
ncbi:hypothetical protein, partial [Psychrobacter sp. AOP7-B1-24]|uniref:hypothetical protein n=1 Tax=Psychrobacter sp. AOP7-B1-24 TaxID=3457645 RepID=UPI00402BB4E9